MQRLLINKSFPMKAMPFRFFVVALLSCVLIGIGMFNLRDRVNGIDSTDGVVWTDSNGILKASAIESKGPGNRAGIKLGDRLLSINNEAVAHSDQLSDFLSVLKPGANAAYELADEAGSRVVLIRLESKTLFEAKDGLTALLAFLHLGIGIFVLLRGDRSSRTFHFYLICLAAFVVYLFSYSTKPSNFDLWVYGLDTLAFLMLPSLFVHFCLRFPVDVATGSRRISLLYIPFLLLGMLHLSWMAGQLASFGLPRTSFSFSILHRIELGFFFAGFLFGGLLLLKRRIEAKDLIIRQQMKWVSYGALAGIVPFCLIYVVPFLLGVHPNFAMELSILLLGLIPLSMGYALIHYKLMDVEVIVRRGAAYFLASSLLLSIYLLFALVMSKALQWIAPQASFIGICFAVLTIALLFAPLRNSIQARLDRLYYRDQFEDRSTLLDFARTLSSEISLEPLSHSILKRISKTFQIDKATIFLADPAHIGFFRLTDSLDKKRPSLDRLYMEEELINGVTSNRPINLKSGTNYLSRAGLFLRNEGFHYLQDLRVHGRQVGMIALGKLPKENHFSTEDLDLLSALAGYAAMALENANLYRSIEAKALELQRLKAYTENIIESINVAVLAIDHLGSVTSCNRAFEDLFNTTRQKITGSPIEDLFAADVIASIQKTAGIETWELETSANIFKFYIDSRAGKRLIVNLSLIPLKSVSTESSGSLLVLDDITEKMLLEDQLMQAEKLSSIGLLAAGIAHEVNTPIAGISSYTQMLLQNTPESDQRKPILEKIEKQTFRAAEIVNGLLNFSRMNASEFKALDINQLISDSLALMNHQLQQNHIKVESRFDDSLPPIYGNMGKLQQVFVNLFLNARDAMPSGGELAVQTGMNESMVIVDISDTGMGISEENLKKIFDPFFTTKALGKGTGLGLAVTYGIIQEHGGRIFVDSDFGKGTHFRLKLPTRLN
jgi:two-component system, NtrC family, sensor kinase